MPYKSETIKKNKIIQQKSFILETIPLSDDDIFIESNSSIPLTHIAQDYYDDPAMWRIIAKVNNLSSMFVSDGRTLRIPTNPIIKFKRD